MKLLILILILFLSFCNFKKNQAEKNIASEKRTDILLLKLNWFEGDVTILRNNVKVSIQSDIELEKEDLIETGANGSAELLLGIDHYIKIGSNSKISVTNLLTTNGDTVTSISVNEGKVLVVTKIESKEEFTILTPNANADTNGSILLAEIYPNKNKSKDSVCEKNTCSTKLIALNGNANIKNASGVSDLILEKNFQIHIGNEENLAQNNILPLDKNSISEIKNMITFHSSEQILDPKHLEDLKITSEINAKPAPVIPVMTKKKALPIQKIPAKKTQINEKAATQKKPLTKDIHRDRLKLEPNKKF